MGAGASLVGEQMDLLDASLMEKHPTYTIIHKV